MDAGSPSKSYAIACGIDDRTGWRTYPCVAPRSKLSRHTEMSASSKTPVYATKESDGPSPSSGCGYLKCFGPSCRLVKRQRTTCSISISEPSHNYFTAHNELVSGCVALAVCAAPFFREAHRHTGNARTNAYINAPPHSFP